MSQKSLYTLWGAAFALCALLGFLQPVQGPGKYLLLAVSLAFFLPPALLLKTRDPYARKLVRSLSAWSLGLTVLLLVLSLVTAMGSAVLGSLLSTLLIIVSTPMVCSGYWALSLFFWACLLIASLKG